MKFLLHTNYMNYFAKMSDLREHCLYFIIKFCWFIPCRMYHKRAIKSRSKNGRPRVHTRCQNSQWRMADCLSQLGFKWFADYANMQLCRALICTVFNCPLIVRFLVNLVLGSEFIYSFNNILLAKIAHFRWITVSQLWKNQA